MALLTRRDLIAGTVAGAAAVAARRLYAQSQPYWPAATWETRSPQNAGLRAEGIEEALAYAGAHNSTGMVILRGGRIVAERYWNGWTEATTQPIFSSSKSLTAVLVGIAIERGLIKGVSHRASDFVPSWKGTPKDAIAIRHMLSMTSGLKVGPAAVSPEIDAFEQTAAQPLDNEPGEAWAYNTPVYRMLIRILELASSQSIDAFTERHLSGPIGMTRSKWDCDPAPNNRTNCTWYRSGLRDMARLGLLMLRRGRWADRQIVTDFWIMESTRSSQSLNESYGYLWWLNGKASYRLPAAAGGVHPGMLWPDCPPDAYGALGALDKKIYIVPSLDLVVARHGPSAGVAANAGAEGGGRMSFDNELLGRVCRAVTRG
jgi:CubicO group peptidase (beta-lactamase class C family)